MTVKKDPILISCKFCSIKFNIQPYRINTSKYCSKLCQSQFRKKTNKENRPINTEMTCAVHGHLPKHECYFEILKNGNHKPHCKKCRASIRKNWSVNNTDAQKKLYKKRKDSEAYQKKKTTEKYKRSILNSTLKNKYGISIDEYETLLEKQNNVCAICLKKETRIDKKTSLEIRLSVDHCHKKEASGIKYVRGLLCNNCNSALGLTNDSILLLGRMIKYLRLH